MTQKQKIVEIGSITVISLLVISLFFWIVIGSINSWTPFKNSQVITKSLHYIIVSLVIILMIGGVVKGVNEHYKNGKGYGLWFSIWYWFKNQFFESILSSIFWVVIILFAPQIIPAILTVLSFFAEYAFLLF